MKILRNIIEIDEERCNGCGQCVLDCAENAIAIIDGKAKVIADALCDGLGACLQGCPQDALHIVQRQAEPFDEAAVHTQQQSRQETQPSSASCTGSCPGATPRLIPLHSMSGSPLQDIPSGVLAHWPVKLRLVPPTAPFLHKAHVLLAADCAPVACHHFHHLAQGKIVLLACPKFEDPAAIEQKLTAIMGSQQLQSLDVLRMEVPCCRGLATSTEKIATQCKQASMLTLRVMGLGGMEI